MNSEFESIEQMKVFYPTEAEFEKPLEYIESLLQKHNAKYGCVKIVPPSSFKPDLAFDIQSKNKLPTRFQVL